MRQHPAPPCPKFEKASHLCLKGHGKDKYSGIYTIRKTSLPPRAGLLLAHFPTRSPEPVSSALISILTILSNTIIITMRFFVALVSVLSIAGLALGAPVKETVVNAMQEGKVPKIQPKAWGSKKQPKVISGLYLVLQQMH
ncbi:hypothetical protein M378DRAFT_566898 [Amanita muscaria Koide BX008]|uniref:Uncharacterized protein n=1 Tax=Amanita muscaria (strain Koide BX008) TaxID=946122 RepID=A0A0C2X6G9_AMAMK|nr:hypothetical protein M378DRAFT_566898 [Amanita muscaria Koide BX008]